MRWGPQCKDGFLPVYSVDTMEEAEKLVVATCSFNSQDGHYYSNELARDQTIETLMHFSDKINFIHQRLVNIGQCTCKPLKKKRTSGKLKA